MQRTIEELTVDQCLALLGRASVGRIVYVDAHGPAAIPVNYAMAGEDVVFRAEPGTKQAATGAHDVAFEVDEVDDDERSAWSVLVRGTGRELDLEELPDLLRHMDASFPTPWVAGVHSAWIAIEPRTITGRRLGARAADVAF
jgi:uncharacterized protein